MGTNNPSPDFNANGYRKKSFCPKQTFEKMVETNLSNSNSKVSNQMLVLSNRIAFNRQTKEKFARSVQAVSGSTSAAEEIKTQLTTEGIDHKTDFGPVEIYSYHQFQKAKPLRNKKYRYIVCDEFHFFTSDGLFNSETNEILHEIVFEGASAIRIYMTATPDVVFEAIIRQEYANFMDAIDNLKEKNCQSKNGFDVISARISARARNDIGQLIYYSDSSIDERLNDLLKTIYPFKIRFYYGKRNYEYIHTVYTYKKLEDLADCIIASQKNGLFSLLQKPLEKN